MVEDKEGVCRDIKLVFDSIGNNKWFIFEEIHLGDIVVDIDFI